VRLGQDHVTGKRCWVALAAFWPHMILSGRSTPTSFGYMILLPGAGSGAWFPPVRAHDRRRPTISEVPALMIVGRRRSRSKNETDRRPPTILGGAQVHERREPTIMADSREPVEPSRRQGPMERPSAGSGCATRLITARSGTSLPPASRKGPDPGYREDQAGRERRQLTPSPQNTPGPSGAAAS